MRAIKFYDNLRNYMLRMAGRSPKTFNTYLKRLRSLLFWAEEHQHEHLGINGEKP